MTILRRHLSTGFAVLPTATLEDSRLSFRARGILAFLIAKPDDWMARTDAIAREGKEGRDAVRKAVQELKEIGYYRVVDGRGADGKVCRYTEVYDTAQEWVATEYGDKEARRLARKLGRKLDREMTESAPTEDGFSGVGEPGVGEPGFITNTHTEYPEEIPPTPVADATEDPAADKEGGVKPSTAKTQEPAETWPQEAGAEAAARTPDSTGSRCRAHGDAPGRSCRACGTSPRAKAEQEQQAQKERARQAAREADERLFESVRHRPMSETARAAWAEGRARVSERAAEAREEWRPRNGPGVTHSSK
ncbi:hypothetical protein ACX9I7_01180 [Streptomyces sp. L500]